MPDHRTLHPDDGQQTGGRIPAAHLSAGPVPGSGLMPLPGRPVSRVRQALLEGWVRVVLVACGVFSICTTAAIIGVLGTETVRFFSLDEVSVVDYLTGLRWSPLLGSEKHFGILPLVVGTLLVTVVAMLIAIPFGLMTAVFLSEYAPSRLRAVLKPVLEVLAGVPTVVYGFFALTAITPALQFLSGRFEIYNVCSAGIAVGIMCLPIVTSISEDALQAVPRRLREGAYGLGATKFDVSVKVVTPAALSGVIAAALLATARAVGETMIVALAAGNLARLLSPDGRNPFEWFTDAFSITEEGQTMTAYMVQIFLGDASQFGPEYFSAYAVGATLFLMTLGLTILGHRIRLRFREVYE